MYLSSLVHHCSTGARWTHHTLQTSSQPRFLICYPISWEVLFLEEIQNVKKCAEIYPQLQEIPGPRFFYFILKEMLKLCLKIPLSNLCAGRKAACQSVRSINTDTLPAPSHSGEQISKVCSCVQSAGRPWVALHALNCLHLTHNDPKKSQCWEWCS